MEYLKDFLVTTHDGQSTYILAYNAKEARKEAKEWANGNTWRLVVRCLGVAVDPHTFKRISRPKPQKQIEILPNYLLRLQQLKQ